MASDTAISTLTMPRPVDFPPLAGDPVSAESWKTLMAIMDAVAPSIKRADSLSADSAAKMSTVNLSKEEYEASLASLRQYAAPSEDGLKQQDLFEAYLAEKPSENPVFEKLLKNILSHVPPAKKRKLDMVLSLLGTRGGSLLLTGYITPLTSLSIPDRTKILHSWRTSALFALRGLFVTFTTLGKLVHVRTSAYHSPLTGFPATPASWVANASFPYEFLDFSSPSFAPSSSQNGTIEIDTDVVIIGSGCGAGVVTHRLATTFGRSLRVLVLEKGRYFDASHFPLSQGVGFSALMEAGGVIESEDGSITVTAGSTFGGGGTVNWSASLQTQHFVRKEWAQERKLPFFESEAFQACLDRVCGLMGVSDAKVVQNHGNRVLLEGARKLGYAARTVPQNCRGEAHEDGYCGMGCWRGEKMGPVNGWFPEAAKKGEVRFVQGMKVDRVLFGKKGKKKGDKKVAVGVAGTWTPTGRDGTSVKVMVKAKKVVVSAGTLWSPVVLMNSGISNPHLGKNLKLHPANFVTAVFEHETKPWEGACLTSVINSFEDLDGKGHGVKIEALCMLPSFGLTLLPWVSGLDYKLMTAKYRHLNTYISLARDRDSGYIYRDPETGTPQVVYTPSEYDRGNIMVGVVAICKILYVQGAKEIHPSLPGFRPFVRSSTTKSTSSATSSPASDALADMDVDTDKAITDLAFLTWLADLKAHGNRSPQTTFGSAHQMGTCRMGATASEGVVDPRGRVWATEGLYVADASVFPSASGVNPMITNMAISDWIAQGVCKELVEEGAAAVRAGRDVMARL
ncbi:GMC oxidoreductase-domain-containing protein [Pseudoneurospora amorphoporcata]|uniref:Long-chain-alcohol oxidase n=1 Tax=Pseudoneurospora amorphoporcata TaxID=241081 RepID=A0AAN6NN40_9PEZI|nr:GMC oxidoreductase-domain-containing protein [Pseudoneurospora amorphoporcata]